MASQPIKAEEHQKTIVMVVGYSPGGLADRLARLSAKYISDELQTSVIVRNVPGAGGVRAAEEVFQSKHNTPTIFLTDSSLIISHISNETVTPNPSTYRPIGSLGNTPFVISVAAESSLRNLDDLIQMLRMAPNSHNYGTPGIHSVHHLTTQLFLQKAGLDAQHIPYLGGSKMLMDLTEQRLTFGLLTVSLASEQIKASRLRALAITGAVRSHQLPDTPTLAERYPGMHAVSTAYLLASPSTPPLLYGRLNAAWERTITTPAFKEALLAAGVEPLLLNHAKVKVLMQHETRLWQDALRNKK